MGPYKVVAAFGNHTYQLERLEQQTIQNECRLKLYQTCTEKRGQAPGILDSEGCKTPGKTIKKTKSQPPRHAEKYIEGSYAQQRERTMHSPELIPRFSSEATNMLEDTGTEIKIEKKSSNAE